MTGRIPFGWITLLTALVCMPIQAQDQMGPPPAYGLQPLGYQAIHNEPGQYHNMPPAAYYQGSGPQIPGPAPRMRYEELPDDLGFMAEDTELGKMLTNTFRHAWFRGEYLLWNISGPGNTLLSEQTTGGILRTTGGEIGTRDGTPALIPYQTGVDFDQTVNSLASGTLTSTDGTTQVPGLNDFSIANMNGFRGTFGLPFKVGTVELSGFVLGATTAQRDEGISIPGSLIRQQIIANPAVSVGSNVGSDGNPATNGQSARFITQILLQDGVRAPASQANRLQYDISYHAKLTTSVWGSEGNFVFESVDPNSPFQVRPTFGLRYMSFQDKLLQNGQYTDAVTTTTGTIVNRQINANAHNNLVGPQVGIRAEWLTEYFSIGFEPRLMMAVNSWQSSLDTANVLNANDPGQSILQRGTTFSPLVDLKAFSNVAISKNLSAYFSYNFIWTGSLNRSYNDIVYNRNSVTNQSDFKLQKVYSTATLQGISFGFEYRF